VHQSDNLAGEYLKTRALRYHGTNLYSARIGACEIENVFAVVQTTDFVQYA
jgi:hypothetical protein